MSDSILEVRDLTVDHRAGRGTGSGARVRAVDGVSFDVGRGEAVALVGESGSGKSSLARALLRLSPASGGRVLYRPEPEGEPVDLFGLRGGALRRVRRDLQVVFQDPQASLNPRHSAGRIIGEALAVHRLAPRGVRERRVQRLLERVGLGRDAAQRWPHEFSGGERQRIAIARALALEPRFLVLDEVTSALDVSVQAGIVNLLADLRRDLGLSYLIVTHDLGLVQHTADRVLVMTLGRVVERGIVSEVVDCPAHPYTRALLAARPSTVPPAPDEARPQALVGEPPSPLDPPKGCSFHPRCPDAIERCRRDDPRSAVRLSETHSAACHLAGDSQPGPESGAR